MKKVCTMFVLGCVAAALVASEASALPPFNKEWLARYKDGNNNAAFVEAVETAKCNVCHVGKSKKDKNEYGKAVAKFLTKKDYEAVKADTDAAQKYIIEGLEKSEAEKAPNGKTYGQMIKAGELPGGPAQ
jgi:hypothetical protein